MNFQKLLFPNCNITCQTSTKILTAKQNEFFLLKFLKTYQGISYSFY